MFGHKGIAARYIPAGATRVADKASDAIAYLYTSKSGKPCSIVYYGKQSKPVFHYRHRDEAAREKSVREAFAGRQAHDRAALDHKAKRLAPNTLAVGDILNTSWGYDQTNREFFEVTEVQGQYVILREVAQAHESTGWEQWKCGPQSGTYIGEPMRKLVRYGDHVTIDDVRTAHKWNVKTVAGVPMGPALHASGYA